MDVQVREAILALIIAAAQQHGVPAVLLRAVCLAESGLRPRALCGVHVPHSREYLPVDRQADAAAHALARWYRMCGTWRGALTFFHTGVSCTHVCTRHAHPRQYADEVFRVAGRTW